MDKKLYHVWLFCFGFAYYLVVPAIVIASKIWEEYPGMMTLYFYYKTDHLLGYYLLVFFIVFFPYLIGAFFPTFCYRAESRPLSQVLIKGRGLIVILLPVLLYSHYLIFVNRGSMFQGYLALASMLIGIVMLIERVWPEKWGEKEIQYFSIGVSCF